jgi:DNA repair/transcription protein MET18/MMS19
MAACIWEYNFSVAIEWAPKIWDSLKFEIWNGDNEEFITGALKVINAMARKLSTQSWDLSDETAAHASFIIGIYKECVQRVVDSGQRFMLSTGRILYAMASVSPYLFYWVPGHVVRPLLDYWRTLDSKSEKTLLIGVLNRLLHARIEVEAMLNEALDEYVPGSTPPLASSVDSHTKFKASLDPFQEAIVEIYWGAMPAPSSDSPDDVAFRVNTIQGLALIMGIPSFLSDMERGTIIQSLNVIVQDIDESLAIYSEAVSALRQISINDPVRFKDITLASFISNLPPVITHASQLDHVIHNLDALTEVACNLTCTAPTPATKHTLFDHFARALLEKLFALIRQPNQLTYVNAILIAILNGLRKFDKATDNETVSVSASPSYHPYAWITQVIFQELVTVKQVPGSDSYMGLAINLDENMETYRFVGLIAGVVSTILRSHHTTPANNLLRTGASSGTSIIWNLFHQDAPVAIQETQMYLQSSPPDKCLVNAFSVALVAGARREDKTILNIHAGDVSLAMINNAIYADAKCTPFARITMLYFLQLLVNKFAASQETLVSQGTCSLCCKI